MLLALYSRLLHDEGVILLQQVIAHHGLVGDDLVGDRLVHLPDHLQSVGGDQVKQQRQQALEVTLEPSAEWEDSIKKIRRG